MRTTIKSALRVSRAAFLPVSLFPYTLGSFFALRVAPFHWVRFVLGGIGVGAIHLAANLINEYWDFKTGADNQGRAFQTHSGGSQAIQEGLVTPEAVHAGAWCLFLIALAIGIGFSIEMKSAALVALAAAGIFISWAYTAQPLALAYRGWGELGLFAAFGPLVFLGGFYLQSHTAGWPVLLLSIPSGLLVASVLLVNEMADISADARVGKRNLAVRIGNPAIVRLVSACLIASCVIPAAGILFAGYPVSFIVALAILPVAAHSISAMRGALTGRVNFETSSESVRRVTAAYHIVLIAMVLFL